MRSLQSQTKWFARGQWVLGGGIVPGSLVLFGGEPGVGKCVAGTTRALDPSSGSWRPITDWAAGAGQVAALDEGVHRLGACQVTAFHDQGVQPVVDLTTRLGRRLRCTRTHPLLTPDGCEHVCRYLNGTHRIFLLMVVRSIDSLINN